MMLPILIFLIVYFHLEHFVSIGRLSCLCTYRGRVSGSRQVPWNNRGCAIAGGTISCESSLYEPDLTTA